MANGFFQPTPSLPMPSGGWQGQAGGLATDLCRRLGLPDSLCRVGGSAVAGWLGSSDPQPGGLVADCPDGYVRDSSGRCVTAGVSGAIERFLPGGRSGTLEDGTGQAVVGAFGVPGMVPMQAGVITRRDGTQAPILRCPAGMVLGKDNICYVRSVLPRQFRKWKAPPKPPISAGDAKAIRRADSARNRVKRLAQKTGFSCKKR